MLHVDLVGKLTSHARAMKPTVGASFTDFVIETRTPGTPEFGESIFENHTVRAYNLLGDDVAGFDTGDTVLIEGTIEPWQHQEICETQNGIPRHSIAVNGYRVIADHIAVLAFADASPCLANTKPPVAPQAKIQRKAWTPAPTAPAVIEKRPWTVVRDAKVFPFTNAADARAAFAKKASSLRHGVLELRTPEGFVANKAQAICMASSF